MSQNDFVIANNSPTNVQTDLNSAFQALASLSSGSSAPGTTYANQLWMDTGNNLLKIRNNANSGWITIKSLDHLTAYMDIISEITSGAGITADGVRLKDSMVKVSGTPTTGGEIGYSGGLLSYHNGSEVVTVNTGDPARLLASGTLSSVSALSLTNTILTTSYKAYEIRLFTDLDGATDETPILRLSTNNGSSYLSGASDYAWAVNSIAIAEAGAAGSGQGSGTVDTADSEIELTRNPIDGSSTGGNYLCILILNPRSATYSTRISWEATTSEQNGGNIYSFINTGIALRRNAEDNNAIQFSFSSGGAFSGDYEVRGLI